MLAPWPRKVQGTKLLGKNSSYYVVICRKAYIDSWEHVQSTGLQKLPNFDLLHFKIRPLVQKLAPWPRKLQGTKLLGKNSSYYVVIRRKVYIDSWEHAQSTGLQKLPHFDLLHFKIRPSVHKLAPWPKKLQGTKLLGKTLSYYVVKHHKV